MARMKSAQTVYYGPAYSGYPSVGSVSANESVEYFWTEGARGAIFAILYLVPRIKNVATCRIQL